MSRFAGLVALLALASHTVAADAWPAFRGPNGDGTTDAKNVPTVWDEETNVLWKVAVHDKGWSSPVVRGDQVWVTTATEDGTDYYAVCLAADTGKVVHDLHLFHADNPPDIRRFNSYASPTPVLDGGRLYAHFGSHGTACVDTATGKVVWTRDDLECDHFRGPASSAIVYKDWLYLLFDGYDVQYAICLNKNTGETVWRKDRDLPYPSSGDLKKAFATAAVFEIDGKPQVVTPAAMGTIAYDAETGREVWRVITGGMNESCRPILAHGLIYLTTGHTSNLVAVKAGRTGDLTETGIAWRADKVAPTRPSPVVVGDLLFMVNDTGIASCLDAKTGEQHWKERFDGKFSASPVYAGGKLYFLTEAGKGYVVAADKQFKMVEENRLDDGCKASPAVTDGRLYVRTLTHLYCIAENE